MEDWVVIAVMSVMALWTLVGPVLVLTLWKRCSECECALLMRPTHKQMQDELLHARGDVAMRIREHESLTHPMNDSTAGKTWASKMAADMMASHVKLMHNKKAR